MKGELREKLDNFLENIKDTIANLESQKESLLKKKKGSKNPELVSLNEKIAKKKAEYNEYLEKITAMDQMRDDLHRLELVKTSKKEKTRIIDSIVSLFTEHNETILDSCKEIDSSIESVVDLDDLISNLKDQATEYSNGLTKITEYEDELMKAILSLDTLRKRKKRTSDVIARIEYLQDYLDENKEKYNQEAEEEYVKAKADLCILTDYRASIIDTNTLWSKLNRLSQKNLNDYEKVQILSYVNPLLDKLEDYNYQELVQKMELNNNTEEKIEDNQDEVADKKEEKVEEVTEKKDEEVKIEGENKTMEDNRFSFNEDGSYNIGKGSIAREEIDLYRQIAVRKPEQPIPEPISFEEEPKKRNNSKIAKAVCYVLAGTIGISAVVGAYFIGRSKRSSNSNNIQTEYVDPNLEAAPEPIATEVPEVIAVMQNSNQDIVNALLAKGYGETSAAYMATNFTSDQIDILKQIPYDARVENYAKCFGFNYNYIDDYENARTIYNITAENTVDYINRAYQIQSRNFFEGASIDDVVKVLIAIDEQQLMTEENNSVANSINNSLNTVLNDSLFNGLTEIDIAKIETLPLFAKDGSDLRNFLNNYSYLAREAIVNPANEQNINDLYNYLSVYAINTFNNNHELSDDIRLYYSQEFIDNATLTNLYDWWIANESFIKPIYTCFFPYDYTDERVRRWEDLEYTMDTFRQDPEFEAICGQSRTLESGE